MPTAVIHVRDLWPGDVYIGRANTRHGLAASKWANPYRIGPDGDRATVIAKYATYLHNSPALLAALPELRGKRLACWCHPIHECHGDVLARLANTLPISGDEAMT